MYQTLRSMTVVAALAVTTTAQAGDPPGTDVPGATEPASAEEVIDALDAAVAQWAGSCKKADAEGLCITRAAPKASPKRCAAPLLGTVTVHPRNAKQAKRAQEGLDRALRLAEHASEPTDDATRTAYREAVARARLAKADLELEEYLAITMPPKLEFFVEEWKQGSGMAKWEEQYERQVARKNDSIKRFKEYFERKTELGRRLIESYAAIEHGKPDHWKAKAALRTAWVSQDMADQLRTTTIPKSIAKAEVRDAYCEALESVSEAPQQQAREAAQHCVDRAAEVELTGPTVETCRDLLGKLSAGPRATVP